MIIFYKQVLGKILFMNKNELSSFDNGKKVKDENEEHLPNTFFRRNQALIQYFLTLFPGVYLLIARSEIKSERV